MTLSLEKDEECVNMLSTGDKSRVLKYGSHLIINKGKISKEVK